jgi:hypothetical protein
MNSNAAGAGLEERPGPQRRMDELAATRRDELHGWLTQLSSLGRWLCSAPLMIALVGAVFTVWLGPLLTRNWQNHQKSLEVRTGLVATMSDSITGAVLTAQYIGTGLFAKHVRDPGERVALRQRGWSQGLREWRISSARIGTLLASYFPEEIVAGWDRFRTVVTDFYRLSGDVQPLERLRLVFELRDLLRLGPRFDWNGLLRSTRRAANIAFRSSYLQLSEHVLAAGDHLVKDVLRRTPDL